MTILPSIFFKGVVLFTICVPPTIWGRGITEKYAHQSKRLHSATGAVEEKEEESTGRYTDSSEEPDDIVTIFDSKRKSSTVKLNDDVDTFIRTTTPYSSLATPNFKSNKENSVRSPDDELENYDDDGKVVTRRVTVKYKEEILPSEVRQIPSLPSVNKKSKNFELKNEETATANSGNVKLTASHSIYEYSSSTVMHHLDDTDNYDYTEEPELHTSMSTKGPLDHFKNWEAKSTDLKKKNTKKESSFDNVESTDKSSIKSEKPLKDLSSKSDKPFNKNLENVTPLPIFNPEALDNYDSTINTSVIDNDKTVKNISVNNESGSNLLEVESVSTEMSKNPKSEGVSDIPQSVNSVIVNKNSIATSENVETLNKTPTIKYSNKELIMGIENKTSPGFPSSHYNEGNTDFKNSTKGPNISKTLRLDDYKNTIPTFLRESSTETTFKIHSKPTKVPDNDISNLTITSVLSESINDIKKKLIPFKKPLVSITPSTVSDSSSEIYSSTPMTMSTVPRINVNLKNKLGISSTLRSKSFSTLSFDPLDPEESFTTVLPSVRNYGISLKSSSSFLPVENSTEEISSTVAYTTSSNDLLIKPITGFSTRKRPVTLNFLSSITPSEVISTTEPSFTLKTISSNLSSQRPSTAHSTPEKVNKNVKAFVPWSTRLQKLSSTTPVDPITTVLPYTRTVTKKSDESSSSEYKSIDSALFEPSTESSSTIEVWTRISTSTSSSSSSVSSSTITSSTSLPDLLDEDFSVTSSSSISSPSSSSSSKKSLTSSSDVLHEDFSTTYSVSDDSVYSTPSSDLISFTGTLQSVTPYSLSDFTSPSYELNSSAITETNDAFSESYLSSPTSLQTAESVTYSSVSNVTNSLVLLSNDTLSNLNNSSEITESVESSSTIPFSSSTPQYSSEISVTYSSSTGNAIKSSSSDDMLSSLKTVSESLDVASGTTTEMIQNTTTERISSASSLPSLSSMSEDNEEFLYTSESVDMFVTNETSSSLPEVSMSFSYEPSLNNSEYFSSTESTLDRINSSSNRNYFSNNSVTTESVLEVEPVSSYSADSISTTASSSSPSSNYYYNITSTEIPSVSKKNLWTVEEVSTLSPTTVHEITGDDLDDHDDEESYHHSKNINNKYQFLSTSSPAEQHSISPSVNPSSPDLDADGDEDEDRLKNETSITTELNNVKIDDHSTEMVKLNTSKSTTSTFVDPNLFGNKTRINFTTEHQDFDNVTVFPEIQHNNHSVEPAITLIQLATETTTLLPKLESTVQYTTSTYSRDDETIHNWTVDNVSEYLVLHVDASLSEICQSEEALRGEIIRLFKNRTGRTLRGSQIAFLSLTPNHCSQKSNNEPVSVHMTFLNESGASISSNLNKDFIRLYNFKGLVAEGNNKKIRVQDVQLMHRRPDIHEENSSTLIAAITISCIAVVCLLLLGILLVILRKRQKGFNFGQRCTPVSLEDYSLDKISVNNSVRRKNRGIRASKRSYGNPAFDDPGAPSHQLNFAGLANFYTNRKSIDEEFSLIPKVSPKMDELPPGAETKNRYANVIPLPETRVQLSIPEGGEPLSDYINANYVKGPKGAEKFYIACQAPMQSTVNDFWRMIWEQQCKIILMLTDLHENGVEKCYDYLPPSEVLDCHRLFGDYQVTLKKREVREKYVISLLQLKNLEANLWREVTHMWYMSWPHQGVPDEGTSIIAFLIEARSYMRSTSGPHVVHCSPGTGRTGTVLAIDLCIRDFEANRSVDIPKTVYALRRDRAGAVQTKDQYAFIYQVLNIYAAKLTGGAFDSI